MSHNLYFDYSATTPVDEQVLKEMMPYFSEIFGNTSSLHSFGQTSHKALEQARLSSADFFGCEPSEIIFTSGATESNNMALRGLTQKLKADGSVHIITSTLEHPAVYEVCKHLEKQDGVQVSYIKPQSNGIVSIEDIKKEINENTCLISIMYVNNEIGTIQPIQAIANMIKQENESRKNKIYLHTDAVQATNYLSLKVDELGVDMLSISGHKIYGPKGIGILYIRKNTPFSPISFGGGHEFGKRSGTINTPLIVGLSKALELIDLNKSEQIKKLRDYLWQQIQSNIDNIKLNGDEQHRVPNNLNVSFVGAEGEAILLGLDMYGIAVSTGSACSSGSLEPSRILMEIGLSHEQAHSSIRFTLGKDTTKQDINFLIEKLKEVVERFRKMAPEY